MTFLHGVYLQTWHLTQPYAAERTFPEVVSLCQSYGLAGIMVKAFDGTDWHATYAPEHDALRSVEQAVEQRDFARSRGIGYLPWTNPLHGSRAFLTRQADLYAALGAAVGMLAFDSEPYPSFWGANRPAGDAAYFMDRFRAGAPDCATVWQPDPRPARLAELRPAEWAPHMNVYAPQVYWPAFGQPSGSVLAQAFDGFQSLGIAEWAPTLPGDADPAELAAALELIRVQGSAGCLVWRVGTTGPSQLEVLRGAFPADPCQALKDGVHAAIAELEGLRERLVGLVS